MSQLRDFGANFILAAGSYLHHYKGKLPDEDGIYDAIFIDKNNNQIFELVIVFDTHTEGQYKNKDYAKYYYDENEDEIDDHLCLDVDFNQEIDYCEELS